MQEIPLGKYAKEHRLSRAMVIKYILQGKLKSKEVIENGRKQIYILVDEDTKPPVSSIIDELKRDGFRIHFFQDNLLVAIKGDICKLFRYEKGQLKELLKVADAPL